MLVKCTLWLSDPLLNLALSRSVPLNPADALAFSAVQPAQLRTRPVGLSVVAGLPATWLIGLGALALLTALFGRDSAFLTSMAACLIAIIVLHRWVVLRAAPAASLLAMVVIFLAKCALSYWMWTAWYYTPGAKPESLQVIREEGGADTNSAVLAVGAAVDYWNTYGFTMPIPQSHYIPTNHRLPVHLLAVPCYLSAVYSEVAIPWNALYSLIAASGIAGIASRMRLAPEKRRLAFTVALLLPFSWLTFGFYKDILLQACLVLVVFALLASVHRVALFVPVAAAGAWLLYGFRTPYMILTVLCAAYIWSFERSSRRLSPRVALGALTLLLLLTCTPFLSRFFSEVTVNYQPSDTEHVPFAFSSGPLSPVKRVIVGLLVPFPWTQPFEIGPLSYTQIPGYAQVTLTLAMLALVVPAFLRSARIRVALPAVLVCALAWMITGMGGANIHSGYVQVAAILLVPCISITDPIRLRQSIAKSFVFLLCGNIIWLLVRPGY